MKIFTIAGFLALSLFPDAHADDTQRASTMLIENIRTDLLSSKLQLAELNSHIEAEKLPLVKEIRAKKAAVVNLVTQVQRHRSVQDSKTISYELLQQEVDKLKEQQSAINELLQRYSDAKLSLKSNHHKIDVTNIIGNDDKPINYSDVIKTLTQLKIENRASTQKTKALLNDGRIISGDYLRVGNNYWFFSQFHSGLLHDDESAHPRLFEINYMKNFHETFELTSRIPVSIDLNQGRALALMKTKKPLFQHIRDGGLWMIPILLLGGLAFILACANAIHVIKQKQIDTLALKSAIEFLENGDRDQASQRLSQAKGQTELIFLKALSLRHKSKLIIDEFLGEQIHSIHHGAQRHLHIVAAVASIAPLLGLLGTVSGMIHTFDQISFFGSNDIASISGGISESLITTEAGLIVAIPVLIIHVLLVKQINTMTAHMSDWASKFSRSYTQH